MLQLLSAALLLVSFARSDAGIFSLSPEDLQQSDDINIATIVHNSPSAVTHTSFIRVHNQHYNDNENHQIAQPHLDGTTTAAQVAAVNQIPTVMVQPFHTSQQLSAIPTATTFVNHVPSTVQLMESSGSTTAVITADTSKVQTLTHTPAHLTFSARPVVFRTLPDIKPVRKISFDESVPSPRNVQYTH